jgi:hypothetical protein
MRMGRHRDATRPSADERSARENMDPHIRGGNTRWGKIYSSRFARYSFGIAGITEDIRAR